MDLYSSIARRKSCRSYEAQPVPQKMLDEIEEAIAGFEPLYPGVTLNHRIITTVKGPFHVEAPHYLIISGGGAKGEAENAGYLFEQLALWFDARDLGCVWLGGAKDAQADRGGKDLITMAFGKTIDDPHRAMDGFKRKPIGDITNAPDDEAMKAVHLAPSGMNLQPWYFEKDGKEVKVYRQKLKPPASLMYKHTDVDMGIALCHYAIACKRAGLAFSFRRSEDLPAKKGFMPFGVIE